MNRKLLLSLCVLMVLVFCQFAYANGIASYVFFWPGLIFINVYYAFPASILASILERPFLTLSGIKQHTLIYSLQANFVSMLIGILLAPAGMFFLFIVGPFYLIFVVTVSHLVEMKYYRSKNLRFRSEIALLGNILSCFILFFLPLFATEFRESHRYLALRLSYHSTWMNSTAFIISALVFLYSFRYLPAKQAKEDQMTSEINLKKKTA